MRGRVVIILLAGGEKRTQASDIKNCFTSRTQLIGANDEKNNNHSLRCSRAPSNPEEMAAYLKLVLRNLTAMLRLLQKRWAISPAPRA